MNKAIATNKALLDAYYALLNAQVNCLPNSSDSEKISKIKDEVMSIATKIADDMKNKEKNV